MHATTRQKFGSLNLKTISAAVASALLFSNAYAAGMGKLTVLSSLGQPLRAEIELSTVAKDEAGALVAKLASPEAFRQAGVDYNSALSSLRFSVEQRGGRQFVYVTSTQPLNEPFVDMLLELGGPNGRLVREYTFLLDPPDMRAAQPAQVAPAPRAEQARANPPQPAVTQPPAAPAEKPVASKPQTAKAVKPAPQESREAGAAEYQVKNGDTLAKIASQYKSGGVSLDQMLVALYQANPDAFAGNNMNRLKAGQILTVPSADEAQRVGKSEARGIVVAQSADFHNYRSKLAGQVATAAPQKSGETKQSASGKITAKVEEKPTPASESKDKLKLSNSATSPAPDKAAGAASAEDKIAKEKAAAEASARIKELEKNVTDLQKVLEVKNKGLAEQQKQAEAAKSEAKPAAPAASTPAVAAPNDGKQEQPKTETQTAPAAASAPNAASPSASAPEASAPAASAPAASAPVVKKPKAVAPPPPPAPEPSFFDGLLDNPLVLPGLGALLVALGGLGIYSARRRKSKQFEDSIITDSSLKANSLFGSTGGQSVDTNNSVFNSSFSPSASQLDTNEVDPVAEADVYIAYGRDAQAEEILKEALRTQPDRHSVRVKLLEIYSNRKDLRAFEVLATELYGLTKGEGDEWAQAASMGAAIDPNNPLYAGGKVTVESDSAPAAGMVAPTQPLEDQGLATLLATTQPDAPSEEISSLETDTSYFNNSALGADAPLELPQETPEPELPTAKADSNDLDFDLDGLDLAKVPNTIPHPAPAEPSADLASIDFDFLDEPAKPVEAAPEPVPQSEPESLADLQLDPIPPIADLEFQAQEEAAAKDAPLELPSEESAALDIGIPNLPEVPAASHAQAEPESPAEPESLDFDLSGINLDLNPGESNAAPELAMESFDELPSLDLNTTSVDAEMATKLDLAIAYREIGDKEGARELLDEVMKGGSPEQSEKAKSLLLELA
ncbi:FimV/HubP family polar landmark protein [Noviherbaspirillum autotrophicum]|uniref:Pilus assembly protein FimV n=1 Tax=Noviherbaspirillum autotrophicum TaxID=709839 RepID=A0A0C2BLY0_9BURK|nr:FimV/HubP family polar landmark protein [Noviherbaspirillum autotrophicum]KIF82260.1 pilus assembly protein FimV [Noviherbaspirillum autotrophicum]